MSTVGFDCDSHSGTCLGTFSFSRELGSAVDMNLSWDQTTLSSGSVGGGSVMLSNGTGGLGGVDVIDGELELDATKSVGTIRLTGTGADALGGSLASATFDPTGPVDRFSL